MSPNASDLVFTIVVAALAAVVVFSFILVIRRFIITAFSPRETAALALVSFIMGMMIEAYLDGNRDMEALSALIILVTTAWLIYRGIQRGWVYHQTKEEMK